MLSTRRSSGRAGEGPLGNQTSPFHDIDCSGTKSRQNGLRGPALLSATREVAAPFLALVEPTLRYFPGKSCDRAVLEDMLLHLCEEFREVAGCG